MAGSRSQRAGDGGCPTGCSRSPTRPGALPQLRALTDPDLVGGEYFGPGGLGEMHGSPKLVKAKRAAYDTAAAQRLWDVSAELTGVHFAWP